MLRLFSKKIDREDWSVVHSTADAWEAELIRSALLNEDIQARVKCVKGEDGKGRQNVISVPNSKMAEARMVTHRTSIVIANTP